MKKMNRKEIKESIENVKASLAVENLTISKINIENGEKYLKGEITSEEAITNITNYIKNKQLKQ